MLSVLIYSRNSKCKSNIGSVLILFYKYSTENSISKKTGPVKEIFLHWEKIEKLYWKNKD